MIDNLFKLAFFSFAAGCVFATCLFAFAMSLLGDVWPATATRFRTSGDLADRLAEVEAERDKLRAMFAGMVARVAAQSELLSRRAERATE
jgi:hypothetical protein